MRFSILFYALLATSIGQGVMLAVLPSLGRDAGIDEFKVAVLMSSSAFIFAIGTNLWSRVSKKIGLKRTLITGLMGYTFGTALFATMWLLGYLNLLSGVGLFVAVLVSRSLQSTIMSATPPAAVGYAISISSSSERVKAISKVTSANNLGQVIGPAYAGVLATFGLLTPLYSVVLLTLIACILVWVKLPELPKELHATNESKEVVENTQPLKGTTALLILACASLFCAMAMLQQSLGFFFIDFYHMSTIAAAQSVGAAMMLAALMSLAMQFSVVQRSRFSIYAMIQLAMPLLIVAYLTMFLHQGETQLYIAMALLGMGMGIAYPSIAALATRVCRPSKQLMVAGMITASPAMGYVTGPPVAALVYKIDERLPFAIACGLMVIMTFVTLPLLRGIKNKHSL